MKKTTPYTRDEIVLLVHNFYGEIREHPELGPIFNAHIQNWPLHLNTMVSFWSSLLLKTADFSGSPMMKHAALPNLSAHLFDQWLDLFHTTCNAHPNPQLAADAWTFAQRIARSLWLGYQIQQQPDRHPTELKDRSSTA